MKVFHFHKWILFHTCFLSTLRLNLLQLCRTKSSTRNQNGRSESILAITVFVYGYMKYTRYTSRLVRYRACGRQTMRYVRLALPCRTDRWQRFSTAKTFWRRAIAGVQPTQTQLAKRRIESIRWPGMSRDLEWCGRSVTIWCWHARFSNNTSKREKAREKRVSTLCRQVVIRQRPRRTARVRHHFCVSVYKGTSIK